MTYQVPQHIDKNKIFVVQRSEIEGRLDPHYNQPEYSELMKKLEELPCKLSSLGKESCAIFSGITPKSGGDAYSIESDAIPFVRSGDFSETNQIDFSKLLYLKPEIHNGIMASSQLKLNDLLIAIVGATIGKIGIYLYDREANINQAVCGVRLKENLSPFYVQAFYQTEIGQKIIERVKRPVARANLNLDEIGSLPIPLVSKSIQEKVVQKLQEGIKNKLQKESEAQQLLDSIIDKVLAELGISLPHIEKTLSKRIFTTSFRQIQSNRFDPKGVLFLGDKSGSSIFENVSLKSIAKICKGNSLTSKEADLTGPYPVIAGGQTSPYNYSIANYQGNVITVSASGAYAGYVWYHDYPIYATDCCVIQSKNEQKYLTSYLYEVLHAQQERIYMYQQGAGQPHVYASDLEKLLIPNISIDRQRRIVSHAQEIRTKAQALQAEGKAILENAKKEVEKMIMGA